jgi:hypothetical protein
MFKLVIPPVELYDQKNNLFINEKGVELQLEHSLIALAKWESKYCKAFLTKEDKSREETIDYIRAMTITQNVDESVYNRITEELLLKVYEYINSPQTATYFYVDKEKPANKEKITSELIYYWMVALQIPFECQKWHLNRLLTLIDVCNRKSNPGKKMSKNEIRSKNRALNEARRAQLGTRG